MADACSNPVLARAWAIAQQQRQLDAAKAAYNLLYV